jgi:hypothetical protein
LASKLFGGGGKWPKKRKIWTKKEYKGKIKRKTEARRLKLIKRGKKEAKWVCEE